MEDLRAYCLGGGQAVGVFFLCPFVLFSSAIKNEVLPGGFFMENLMVIVNMFVA